MTARSAEGYELLSATEVADEVGVKEIMMTPRLQESPDLFQTGHYLKG